MATITLYRTVKDSPAYQYKVVSAEAEDCPKTYRFPRDCRLSNYCKYVHKNELGRKYFLTAREAVDHQIDYEKRRIQALERQLEIGKSGLATLEQLKKDL